MRLGPRAVHNETSGLLVWCRNQSGASFELAAIRIEPHQENDPPVKRRRAGHKPGEAGSAQASAGAGHSPSPTGGTDTPVAQPLADVAEAADFDRPAIDEVAAAEPLVVPPIEPVVMEDVGRAVARIRGAPGEVGEGAPPGCSFRRFTPAGKHPFWEGKLPQGVLYGGKNSCTKRFHAGLRSEDAAKTEVLQFLVAGMRPRP
jgi:hypothetical protein